MYWNRSGKITVEPVFMPIAGFDYFIDGKKVHSARGADRITLATLYKKVGMYHKPTKVDSEWIIPAKEFYKKFGATPTSVVKWVNGHIFRTMVLPYKHLSFLFKQKNIHSVALFQVIENIDTVNQMMNDGQKNLIPIIKSLGWMSVSDAKYAVGKSNWKKLCKNSVHRNKLIAKQLDMRCVGQLISEFINEVIGMESGALDLRCNTSPELARWLKHECKITFSEMRKRSVKVRGLKILWMDTQRMAQRIRREFNPMWSVRRMQEEHDALFAEMNAAMTKHQRAVPQEILDKDLSKDFPTTTWELNGVRASLLTTYERICKEGRDMKHCVASYAEQSMDGRYLVVHIDGDVEATTVGYHIIGKSGIQLSQHYGKHNADVRSQNHKDLVEIVQRSLEIQLEEKYEVK